MMEEKLSNNYVRREVRGDISKYLSFPNVLALLGIRRSGKSTVTDAYEGLGRSLLT
uniref:hypothetical protein n=1 Tax=Metallosphaera hakonensis TaxID=79601 RepID=UPI000A9658C5|nr:hypothetical protein [Metallosphaera hakonensis]